MDTFAISYLSSSPDSSCIADTPDSNYWINVANLNLDEESPAASFGYVLSESPQSGINDSFGGLSSMDLDPLATLFAFNTSCSSPSCK